jgi:methionyl aminopeptidase
VGVRYRGFIGDSAWTYAVGAISAETQRVDAGDGSQPLRRHCAVKDGQPRYRHQPGCAALRGSHGMSVVREYTGHGVGRQMHEAPQVLNYVSDDSDGRMLLRPGLVVAIEPMVQAGTWQTRTLKDNWTVVSKDGSMAAHFEHTVAITNKGRKF